MRKGLRKSVYFLLGVGLIVGAVYGHNSVLAQTWQGTPSLGGSGGANVTVANTWTAAQTFSSRIIVGGGVSAPQPSIGFSNLGSGAGGFDTFAQSDRMFWNDTSGNHLISFHATGGGLSRMASGYNLCWTSVASGADNTCDVSLTRNAAGVIKIGGADGTTSGYVQVAAARSTLSADYTNATASFTNTALSHNVTSGRRYTFRLALMFADSTAADGAQFDFNGGSATMTNFRFQCNPATNAAGATLAQSASGGTTLSTANSISLALTTQTGLECFGVVEPSSTSTFIVRAAQAAHSTGTLTVFRGSHLWLEDVP